MGAKQQLRKRGSQVLPSQMALALMLFWQGLLLLSTVFFALSGEWYLAAPCLIGLLVFFWATGALLVTLPLNIRFFMKYQSDDSNYAAIDLEHRKALKLLKRLPVSRHPSVSAMMSNLGILRLCQAHYESAASLFEDAKAYLGKQQSAMRDPTLLVILNNLAISYIRMQKYVEAEFVAAEALEISESAQMQKDYKMLKAAPLAVLGSIRLRLNEFEKSKEYYEQALELYENAPAPKYYAEDAFHQAKAFCYFALALIEIKAGRRLESIKAYGKAVALVRERTSHFNTLTLEPLYMLANEYMNQKLFEEAEALLELAYRIGRDHPFHPDSKLMLSYYEKLFLLTGRQAEVQDMRSWLRPSDCRLLTG